MRVFGVLPIAILVMWPKFRDQIFVPLTMDAPHKISLIGQAVSEKKIFEKCVWMTDRSRSRDDLDLN